MNSHAISVAIILNALSQSEKRKKYPAVPAGVRTYKNFSLPSELEAAAIASALPQVAVQPVPQLHAARVNKRVGSGLEYL